MSLLRTVRVVDAQNREILADVPDDRYRAYEHFVRSNAQQLGLTPEMARTVAHSRPQTAARDATEAIAFSISQLAFTEMGLYAKEYIPTQWSDLVPLDYSAGAAATTVRIEMVDYAGQGQRYNPNADDIPMADVHYGEQTAPVMPGAIGYRYNQQDFITAAFLRRNLPQDKMTAAVEGYERHMNAVATTGEAQSNLTGLFNNANVPSGNRPSGAVWDAATPATILNDINTAIQTVWTNTQFNDVPSELVVAPQLFTILQRARDTGTDLSILNWVLMNNLAKSLGRNLTIRPGYGLDTAGSGGTRRIVAYVRDPSRVKMHIPMALQFMAPQLVNMDVKVIGMYRYSGVLFRRPKTAYYMDGA